MSSFGSVAVSASGTVVVSSPPEANAVIEKLAIQSTASIKQQIVFSLFFHQFVSSVSILIGFGTGRGFFFACHDKLIQSIGRKTKLVYHTEDVGVLNLDNVRINLFVSLLQRSDFRCVFLTLLTELDNFQGS